MTTTTATTSLLSRPELANVKYNPRKRHFECIDESSSSSSSSSSKKKKPWRAMRGLTKLMAAAFFPNYNYFEAQSSRHRNMTYKDPDDSVPLDTTKYHVSVSHPSSGGKKKKKPSLTLKKKQKSQQALGQKIDKQLERAVNKRRGLPLPSDAVITKHVLQECERAMNWKPERAQLAIASPKLRVATAIDMVLSTKDAEKKLVVIDNKLGFVSYDILANGFMSSKSPLYNVPNHPRNQHYLQIVLELAMLREQYGVDTSKCDAYVVQASEHTVIFHPLPAWIRKEEQRIWEYFCAFCTSIK